MPTSDEYIQWMYDKRKLQKEYENAPNAFKDWFVPRRALYTCRLGANIGDEKGTLDSRPVLVISADDINSRSSNVVIIPLSKNIKWRRPGTLRFDTHYVLKMSKYTKLRFDSAVQCEDLRVISKTRLGDFIQFIDDHDMKEIQKRLRKLFQF